MEIYQLGDIENKKAFLKSLGVESGGISIMAKKMQLFYFYIKELRTPAANILKQDALSIGADLAVPGGVITCEKPVYDCLLIGTKKHMEILARKELAQPFGLKKLAQTLKHFLNPVTFPLKIMGVINANEDSFFEGSRFVNEDAIVQIEKMIEEGAQIIDIGAVSSRPGAMEVDPAEELARMEPICNMIKEQKLYEKVCFSIDSYTPAVIEYALKSGFGLVNDITGARDNEVVALAVKYDAKLCIMHMQGVPQSMQKDPVYGNVILEMDQFFEGRLAKCEALGLKREKIILDVGIGFGKTVAHNLELLRNLSHFRHFGCEILIGASRKSMIDKIIPTETEARLPGTLALHLKAVENGASIIRCHDVAEHRQAFEVQKALQL